jgi:hypothetical protein
MMEEELRITVDADDLRALVQKRYKVLLTPNDGDSGHGDVHYVVTGDPLAVGRVYNAIKRAAKAKA